VKIFQNDSVYFAALALPRLARSVTIINLQK